MAQKHLKFLKTYRFIEIKLIKNPTYRNFLQYNTIVLTQPKAFKKNPFLLKCLKHYNGPTSIVSEQIQNEIRFNL